MRRYGPVSARHYLFGLGVCLTATIAGVGYDAWQAPRYPKPATIAEAEQIVEEALKARYHGTRYDEYDATVSGCEIVLFRHDNDVCNVPHSLHTFTQSYDLRMVSLDVDNHINAPRDEGYMKFVSVRPRPAFEERIRAIKARDDALITQARAEVGWGPQAAALKSDWFRAEFDDADLPLWKRTGVCNGDIYFSAHRLHLSLVVPDLEAADRFWGLSRCLKSTAQASKIFDLTRLNLVKVNQLVEYASSSGMTLCSPATG